MSGDNGAQACEVFGKSQKFSSWSNKFCDTFRGITFNLFLDINFNEWIYTVSCVTQLTDSDSWLLFGIQDFTLLSTEFTVVIIQYVIRGRTLPLQPSHIKYVGRALMSNMKPNIYKQCQILSDLKPLPSIQQNFPRDYMFRNLTENFLGKRCSFFPGLNSC